MVLMGYVSRMVRLILRIGTMCVVVTVLGCAHRTGHKTIILASTCDSSAAMTKSCHSGASKITTAQLASPLQRGSGVVVYFKPKSYTSTYPTELASLISKFLT